MESNVRDFILDFTSILYEALPFVILGAVFAGFVEEFVPQRLVARFVPRSRGLAIAASGLLGLIFPMCECGIIVVMRRLLRKGLPLGCCIAYLLAGPIINFIVLLSTYVAFYKYPTEQMGGPWMMILRAAFGYLTAVGTALVVDRLYQKHGTDLLAPLAIPDVEAAKKDGDDENGEQVPALRRAGNVAETALHDFIDITVFLILGALLSALVRQLVGPQELGLLSDNYPALTILAMMGLAIAQCLCSEADAFVAASFSTVQPAAKLAFLVLGPMMDLKLYAMYTRVFRPRLILVICACVSSQVFVYSMAMYVLWPKVASYLGP